MLRAYRTCRKRSLGTAGRRTGASPRGDGAAPPRHRGEEPGRDGGGRHGQALPAASPGQGAGGGAAEVPAGLPHRGPRGSGSRGEHG